MALRRFSAVSRPTIHKTNPDVASRRLPVVIAELKDKGPILSKLVFCRAATKEMIGTTLAFGIRAQRKQGRRGSQARRLGNAVRREMGAGLSAHQATWRLPLPARRPRWAASAVLPEPTVLPRQTLRRTQNFRSASSRRRDHEQGRRRHPYIHLPR